MIFCPLEIRTRTWQYVCMSAQESKPRKKQPRDLNLLAASIVNEATEIEEAATKEEEDPKNPNAVALGRLGGLKGGRARAERLTPEERSEIAKRAAQARWNRQPKK
jgi:hypothetical protein